MNLEEIKSVLIGALKDSGADEYEIYYMSSREMSTETLNREISAFNSSQKGGICLRVLSDGKMGYAATELMEKTELEALVRRAMENAKYVEKLDTVGIYRGGKAYEENRCAGFSPIGASELRSYVLSTGEKLFSESDKVKDGSVTEAVSYGFDVCIINSHGLELSNSSGVNILAANAVVESDGESQSAFSIREIKGDVGNSINEVVSESVNEALSRIGAVGVPSGKYNIIIDGKQMRALLSVFSAAFSARRVLDGMSALKGQLGERVASECISITDDAQRAGNSVGTPFDAEGVPTSKKSIIDKGFLTTYLHNRETAMKMGVESTANASKSDYSSPIGIRPHSFCIEPGACSFNELLTKAKDGIYITALKGLHAGANPITGDFSLESEGFMIRDGKLAEAVKTFTVAANFFSLLKSVSAVSDELKTGVATGFTSFGSPDVFVENVSIAGE